MAKQTTSIPKHPFQRAWGRDLLITGLLSLLVAMAMLLYTFGLTNDFIFRLFNAFLGIFVMITGTAFVIIPSVNWLFSKFTKRKTATAPTASKRGNTKRNTSKTNYQED